MTTQFEVGKTYKITGSLETTNTITIVRRTEVSAWFTEKYNQKIQRKKIYKLSKHYETINITGSFVSTSNHQVEPVTESQDIIEVTATPNEVPQDVAETPVITEDNDEPCTVVETPQDVIEATETTTESQDNQDTVTSPRLEILKKSLAKKEKLYDDKISAHFSDVRSANGQPLNDKRNGYQTLDRWERQNDSIRSTKAEIEKTKQAIEREEYKIENVNSWQEIFPSPITDLLESGILTQWRKFPRIMFVAGVKKARITYDPKTGTISNSYVSEINNAEQYTIFRDVFNQLKKDLSV
jgi:hypothetical protein